MDDVDIRFGSVVMQPARRRLLRDGRALAVGARAFDVLAMLVAQRHRIVTKAELLDAVWPDAIVEEANLAVQVSTLRRLIGGDAIATIPGRGYRFVAPVEAHAPAEPGRAVPDPVAPRATAAPPAPNASRAAGLPRDASPLIGRDEDRTALAAAWSTARLVSIVGAGGIGKTRLALAHAQEAAPPDGARWVDLAPVARDEDVVAAVAQACAVALPAPTDAAALAAALAQKSLLLVLDNAEHVAAGTAALARALLAGATGIRVLVTAQAPLGVAGERVHRLPPLAVPPPDAPADESYAAVRLFVERAQADNLRFGLDSQTAADVAAICRALDGLPLAIVLAAARVRLLGVRGVRERLDQMLRLLTTVRGRGHDLPARQQALRATLEWSHDLLALREQRLLRLLAPFVGGFTLELAQRVAIDTHADTAAAGDAGFDAWGVLDALGTLVDRSIVEVDGDEPPRYRLLETMRAFALERLAEAGETAAARTRHARALAALFSRVTAQRIGEASPPLTHEQALALTRPEFENMRAALAWTMGEGFDAATAIELAGAGASLAFQVGAMQETVQRLLALRPHLAAAAPAQRAMLLQWLFQLGELTGMPLAERHAIKEEAVREARASGVLWLRVVTLAQMGWALATEGDTAGAEVLAQEMRQIMPPDASAVMHMALANLQARIYESQQRYDDTIACMEALRTRLAAAPGEAVNLAICETNLFTHLLGAEHYERALALARPLASNRHVPAQFRQALYGIVHALAALGRVDEALAEARACRRELETGNLAVFGGCEALTMLALARGRVDDAVRIFAVVERHERALGDEPHRATDRVRERLAAACAAASCRETDLAAWRAEGEQLDTAALVDLALG